MTPYHWHYWHTHTQPLNGPMSGTTRVGQKKHSHSHPSWSSNIPYQPPPSTTIHSILLVQFTFLTVLFHNLSPGPLVFLLVWNPLLHTPYIASPNHHLLFVGTTERKILQYFSAIIFGICFCYIWMQGLKPNSAIICRYCSNLRCKFMTLMTYC